MDGLCEYVLVIVRIPFPPRTVARHAGMRGKKKRQVECMVQRSEIGAEVVKPSLFPFPFPNFEGEPNSKSKDDDEMAFRVSQWRRREKNCRRRWSFELCEIAAFNFSAGLDATRHGGTRDVKDPPFSTATVPSYDPPCLQIHSTEHLLGKSRSHPQRERTSWGPPDVTCPSFPPVCKSGRFSSIQPLDFTPRRDGRRVVTGIFRF